MILSRAQQKLQRELAYKNNWKRIFSISKEIHKRPITQDRPVVFFNASTRLEGLSLNAAFSLITSWAIRFSGVPVTHFVCARSMSHCVLGTNNQDVQSAPPCRKCIETSRNIYVNQNVHWAEMHIDKTLEQEIANLSLIELINFAIKDIPIGNFVLPSMRWILRKHNLEDTSQTRYVAQEYIKSAYSIYNEFLGFIQNSQPQAVVVFNGMFYPEAMARFAAKQHSIPVYTHEVGMLPNSAFFTANDATAYPVEIENDFELNEEQIKHLNDHLQKRFEGDFVTAGIRFWPEMKEPDVLLQQKMDAFHHLVPIFTNVVFDTSQSHANVVFPHMFAWLDRVLDEIKAHPDTLFVIRAHPDELRPNKESQETVDNWIERHNVEALPNVIYIRPNEFISSYDLIKKAKFVLVYNSTIGLEASLMGVPVLCAGKARYTQIPTVYFPQTTEDFSKAFLKFLSTKRITPPKSFQNNAKRVLYSQLFRASLPLDEFIESDQIWNGFVRFKDFSIDELDAEINNTIRVILRGILYKEPFIINQ